jgi:Integrase core domain
LERWHQSLKSECIRPGTPLSLEDARRLVEGYVEHYNNVRLNSAAGYITPKDLLADVSRRSTRNATASWKPPDSNARVTAGKPREEQATKRFGWLKESYFDS